MSAADSFADLMTRLRAGDEPAAAELFHRFADRLIALARARLDQRLRPKIDPEDVLQSVYRSFFRRHTQGQFELADWDSLWSLLTFLTVRKCGRWGRRFQAERRDIGREVPTSGGLDLLDREPTPDEAAVLAETVEQLLRGLEDRDRAIVTLSLQGYGPAEISARLGRPQRTVFRVLERVNKRLHRLQET